MITQGGYKMANDVTLEHITEYLRQDDWRFDVDEERQVIRTGFRGRNGSYRLIVNLQKERDALLFSAPGYLTVPEEHDNKDEVLSAMMAINYQLLLGNFERDISDGEIRFRLAVPLEDNDFTYEQFQRCLFTLAYTIDKYYPIFQRMLWAGLTAEQALAEEESAGEEITEL